MAFDAFDHDKKGCISTDMVSTILGMLGHEVSSLELAQIIAEIDTEGKYDIIDNAIFLKSLKDIKLHLLIKKDYIII